MMTTDEKYISRCLQLARQGEGYTAPNPMVGAVIVAEGRIIGEGFHRRYGEAHAEVNAFANVSEEHLLPQSTLYVSLEPCAHYGKTPPCAELIIRKGVKRVVVGVKDPFEKVAGRGIQMLRDAGIDVTVGVLEEECRALIRPFTTLYIKKRPYITLKWTQSADGYIDSIRNGGEAVKLSTPLSSVYVHAQRAKHQAILVGRRTAEWDNPSLTVRGWTGKQPLRLVIDRTLTLPRELRLFTDGHPTVVFTLSSEGKDTQTVQYIVLKEDMPFISQLLTHLYERNIQTLLVEGGSELLQSFIDAGLWDEAYCEYSHVRIGKGVPAPVIRSYQLETHSYRDMHMVTHYVHTL